MNIHPLVVHFPIAFLAFYSLLEVLTFFSYFRAERWFFIRGVLASLGAVAGVVAVIFGGVAEEALHVEGSSLQPLVEMHESFAAASLIVFFVLGAAYASRMLSKEFGFPRGTWPVWMRRLALWKQAAAFVILNPRVRVPLAIIGFILLTIAGALGAAIAHGPAADFIVQFVYNLFF